MRKKNLIMALFIMMLILLSSGTMAEAKTNPKLAVKTKAMTAGQIYQLRLKGVPVKGKVRWKTSKKSVVSIAGKKGILLLSKQRKKEHQ